MSKAKILAPACACAVVLCVVISSPVWAQNTWTVYTPEGSQEVPVPTPTTVYVGEGEAIDYGEGVVTGTGQGQIITVDEEVIPGPGGTPASGPVIDGWGRPRMAEDKEGNIWFVPSGKDPVSKFDGTQWTTYTWEDGLGIFVTGVAVDHEGDVWFSGYELDGYPKGTSRFDGENWTRYDIEAGDVSVAPNGDVWFCGQGAYRFDGSQWRRYTTEDGLGYPEVNVVDCDSEGNVWFGLGAIGESLFPEPLTPFGVTEFDGTTWISYGHDYGNVPSTAKEDLHEISSITVDRDNTKWVGTERGLLSFDGEVWRKYVSEEFRLGLTDLRGGSVDPGGGLWFGTGAGLTMKGDGLWPFFDYYEVGWWAEDIFFDSRGGAWISTGAGIIRCDCPTVAAVEGNEPGTPTCFRLLRNVPNPFNASTRIVFSLAEEREATLRVFNSVGQVVDVLMSGKVSPGNHVARWDGHSKRGIAAASGIYLVELRTGAFAESKKMLLLK